MVSWGQGMGMCCLDLIIRLSVSFTQCGDAWKTKMDVEVGTAFDKFTEYRDVRINSYSIS